MIPVCQYTPKGLKGDWIALYLYCIYLMHQVSFCGDFWRARRIYPLSPFLSSGRLVGFVWVQFWPVFEVLLIDHHEEQGVERCSDILTDPHVPTLDGGWN